jgi:hypothetical protein
MVRNWLYVLLASVTLLGASNLAASAPVAAAVAPPGDCGYLVKAFYEEPCEPAQYWTCCGSWSCTCPCTCGG